MRHALACPVPHPDFDPGALRKDRTFPSYETLTESFVSSTSSPSAPTIRPPSNFVKRTFSPGVASIRNSTLLSGSGVMEDMRNALLVFAAVAGCRSPGSFYMSSTDPPAVAADSGSVDAALEDGDGCRASFRCPCEPGKVCSYWDGKNTEITCEVKKVVAETVMVVRAARPGEVP